MNGTSAPVVVSRTVNSITDDVGVTAPLKGENGLVAHVTNTVSTAEPLDERLTPRGSDTLPTGDVTLRSAEDGRR